MKTRIKLVTAPQLNSHRETHSASHNMTSSSANHKPWWVTTPLSSVISIPHPDHLPPTSTHTTTQIHNSFRGSEVKMKARRFVCVWTIPADRKRGGQTKKRSDWARQISGGWACWGSVGNLCMGTGQEADTKPADYRPAGCVGVLFVSVTHRPNRKGRSACFISTKLSHHLLG